MYCCNRQARVNIPNEVFLFSSDVFHEKKIRIGNQPSLISTNNATFYVRAKFYFQISFTLRLLLVECCWCGGPCDYCCTLANRKCKVENDVILLYTGNPVYLSLGEEVGRNLPQYTCMAINCVSLAFCLSIFYAFITLLL